MLEVSAGISRRWNTQEIDPFCVMWSSESLCGAARKVYLCNGYLLVEGVSRLVWNTVAFLSMSLDIFCGKEKQ